MFYGGTPDRKKAVISSLSLTCQEALKFLACSFIYFFLQVRCFCSLHRRQPSTSKQTDWIMDASLEIFQSNVEIQFAPYNATFRAKNFGDSPSIE